MTGVFPEKHTWFRTVCRQNGLEVDDEKLQKLREFESLLLSWNQSVNLISRKDEENLWLNHILHSAAILFKLQIPANAPVVDLGTGGGFPGIPLKILQPNLSITLLDSTQKKIKVVQEIVHKLKLERTSVVWGRAEELGKQKEYLGRYDIIVARAVAPLGDLVKWSIPFLRKRSRTAISTRVDSQQRLVNVAPPTLLALKGGELEGELKRVRSNKHIRSVQVVELALAGSAHFELNDKKVVLVDF